MIQLKYSIDERTVYVEKKLKEAGIYEYDWFPYFCDPASGTGVRQFLKCKFTKDLAIFVIRDNLCNRSHNFKTVISDLKKLAKKNRSVFFIIFNEHFGLEKHINEPNMEFVTLVLTPDKTNSKGLVYKPIKKRVASYSKQWVTFANGPSAHRILLANYLAYKELDLCGHIFLSKSILGADFEKNLKKFNFTQEFVNKIGFGIERFEKGFGSKFTQGYTENNILNYDRFLRPMYEQVFLEIVSSTTYFEPYVFLTEKELQSIYAKNFMIMIGNPFAVKQLEVLGIDMFRDVVDHSYDEILDPGERLVTAIESNIDLLNGKINLSREWKSKEKRFKQNINAAKNIQENILKITNIQTQEAIGHYRNWLK